MRFSKAALAPGLVTLVLLLACGGSSRTGSGSGALGGAASSSSSSSGGGGAAPGDAGPDGLLIDADLDAPALVPQVYMNSGTQLFVLDLTSSVISLVGPLTGCSDQVQDIALDDNQNMIASDGTMMWNVDRTTGACLGVAASGPPGSLPVAITFVPKDTFGTPDQALVGYTSASAYVRVDLSTNQVTPLGSFGSGYALSGDFVSVNGGPTYASVVGMGCNDCIVEVDVKTGAVIKSWGSTGHRENGLAYWAGVVYGFNPAGEVVTTSFMGGSAQTMALSINPMGYSFIGAGSTTAAPMVQ